MLKVDSKEVFTFEAKTLEEVYAKASESLNCSITKLELQILQTPRKGIFGFLSKNAIISAQIKILNNEIKSFQNNKIKVDTLTSRLNTLNMEEQVQETKIPKMVKQVQKDNLFNDFYLSKQEELYNAPIIKTSNLELSAQISKEVNNLFSLLCYEIDDIEVDIIENGQTIYIEFSGPDSPLLIGKEGYRYKALSYVLFNWINEKYGMMLRLEIAQFLLQQERAIFAYLDPIIEIINDEGYFKTKILDGILVHIALIKLRKEFPDKYVAVKTTKKGEKYILVNEYIN